MQGLLDHPSQSCTNTGKGVTDWLGRLRVARGAGSQRGRQPDGQRVNYCCDEGTHECRGAPLAERAVLQWPLRLASTHICRRGPYLVRPRCAEQG